MIRNPSASFMMNLLRQGQAGAPPEAFQAFLNLAEHVLSPDDWKDLKSKIEIK